MSQDTVAVWQNGEPAEGLTPEQVQALQQIAERFSMPLPVEIARVFKDTAVIVQTPVGLWLGVESDGYTHS